jgi:hypothetical protein
MARFPCSNRRRLLADVLGTRTVTATIGFPAPRAWFQQEIHTCADMDRLLANQTLLPWYKPFLPPEQRAQIKLTSLEDLPIFT